MSISRASSLFGRLVGDHAAQAVDQSPSWKTVFRAPAARPRSAYRSEEYRSPTAGAARHAPPCPAGRAKVGRPPQGEAGHAQDDAHQRAQLMLSGVARRCLRAVPLPRPPPWRWTAAVRSSTRRSSLAGDSAAGPGARLRLEISQMPSNRQAAPGHRASGGGISLVSSDVAISVPLVRSRCSPPRAVRRWLPGAEAETVRLLSNGCREPGVMVTTRLPSLR